jgi:hypothetical protein
MTYPGREAGEVRIVAGGTPTDAELAALVVVVAASARAPGPATTTSADRIRGGWADRSAGLRRPLRAGAGAWRHSSS